VAKLTEQYSRSTIHVYTPGRKLKGKASDHAEDFIDKGVVDLERQHTLENWWKGRAYQRGTEECWEAVGDDVNVSQ